MDRKTFRLLEYIASAPHRSYDEIENFHGSPLKTSLEFQRLFTEGVVYDVTMLVMPEDNITRLAVTPYGREILEDERKRHRLHVEERLWKFFPIFISMLALILSTIALLESLHWIRLAK